MKKSLLLSFDLIRPGEPEVSYALGCLIAYLKSSPNYGQMFSINHESFNLYKDPTLKPEDVVDFLNTNYALMDYDSIVLSCYVWADHLINPVIMSIRKAGFSGKIVLGGYQIQPDSCVKDYPGAQFYISGNAESSLLQAVESPMPNKPVVLQNTVDYKNLPSAYLSNQISLRDEQPMVRMETRRGCLFQCGFCSHKDLRNRKVSCLSKERMVQEITLFKEKSVGKINMIDPVFNHGGNYLNLLQKIIQMELSSKLSLQSRFEMIRGKKGRQFLDLCSEMNVVLEFGLQTIQEKESKAINRRNNSVHIQKVLHHLNKVKIPYEVSLIYGLPYQTLNSFMTSISFLKDHGCTNIHAFPLMLLKGTELSEQKQKFEMVEESIGEYNIPVVTQSSTFSQTDWEKMSVIAEDLINDHQSNSINQRFL
jgi:radical SAM superfamily enzyme YgiQ (UPF0313 family)